MNEKNRTKYLVGDYNFDLLKVSNHEETSNFFKRMTANNLLPVISIPTKINNINDTVTVNTYTS